jgi:hypothetical protein
VSCTAFAIAITGSGEEEFLACAPLRDTDPAQVGRYRLTARLGAGGMGVVYLGTDPGSRDSAPVAVKVLRPELADDPEFRDRFGREVTNLTRVKGVCTVRVIEADTVSDRPFMVTEYVPGPSLSEYVARYGPPDPDMMYGPAHPVSKAPRSGTSATGSTWTTAQVSRLTEAGQDQVSGLASSGPAVFGVGSVATKQAQQALILSLAG